MCAAWAPEDQHRSDMGRILLAQKPLYRVQWRNRSTSQLPSANWEEQSSGLAVWDKYEPGIVYLANRRTETNNFLRGETLADPPHYTFSYEALCWQRRFLRRDGHNDLAQKIDADCLQWWAQIVLTANQMSDPNKSIFAWAHQRTVAAWGANDPHHDCIYYWRRGLGMSHSGTGLGKMADATAKDQAPFTPHLFADGFLADLKSDVARVVGAYKVGGFGLVARMVKRGSRGTLHWLRFSDGGYLSCIEADFGVDEPRYFVQRNAAGLRQFPTGTVRRNNRNGGCKLDVPGGKVAATDSEYGSLTSTFDPAKATLWATSSPAGVTINIGGGGAADTGSGVPAPGSNGVPSGNPAVPGTVQPPPSGRIHKSVGIYGWHFGQPLPVKF